MILLFFMMLCLVPGFTNAMNSLKHTDLTLGDSYKSSSPYRFRKLIAIQARKQHHQNLSDGNNFQITVGEKHYNFLDIILVSRRPGSLKPESALANMRVMYRWVTPKGEKILQEKGDLSTITLADMQHIFSGRWLYIPNVHMRKEIAGVLVIGTNNKNLDLVIRQAYAK